jgi:hypothetical protein
VGGALQASTSFIKNAVEDPQGIDFTFVVSPRLVVDLKDAGVKMDTRFVQLAPSPARLVDGYRVRKQLLRLERECNPDLADRNRARVPV